MAIVKFTPWKELNTLHDRMNRLFEDAFESPLKAASEFGAGGWIPAVDIYESDKEIVLKAELSEMDEKDIDIKLEENTLIIKGERKLESETKEEDYHRIERAYGSFSRSFNLPHYVEREKIKANYKDGVLKVTLPKKAESKPKQIKISAA